MIKILSSKQIKELDTATIQREPILSIDLMERACHAFVDWFKDKFDVQNKIGIVCGSGNNGGDGLGIARLLDEAGYSVEYWIVRGNAPETKDFVANLMKIGGKVKGREIKISDSLEMFNDVAVIVDAIFGSGLSRPAEGFYAQVIEAINKSKAIKVAVDIPSGLMCDQPSDGAIVMADFTLSFQLPKLAFMVAENSKYLGQCSIANIGLNQQFIDSVSTTYFLTEKKDVRNKMRQRKKFDHKGIYGHVLIVAGSYGKIGANVLATKAALRTGSGLVTAFVPTCGYEILQTAVPEAMVITDPDHSEFSECPPLENYTAIGVGPGLGQSKQTAEAFSFLLQNTEVPLVIDADAINILSENKKLLDVLPKKSILTPHPGEFWRLAGPWKNDFEKLKIQQEFAQKLSVTIILKGGHSSIAFPDGRIFFNSTGNPFMATAGSGDVLTGVITSLVGQGYGIEDSAWIGVFLHGLAGDIASNFSQPIIAADLIQSLPKAWKAVNMVNSNQKNSIL